MGSFDVTCHVSRQTIHEGDECYLLPIRKIIDNIDDTCVGFGLVFRPTEFYEPFMFPIKGTYADYGTIDAEKTEQWELFETNNGISVQFLAEQICRRQTTNFGLLSGMWIKQEVYNYLKDYPLFYFETIEKTIKDYLNRLKLIGVDHIHRELKYITKILELLFGDLKSVSFEDIEKQIEKIKELNNFIDSIYRLNTYLFPSYTGLQHGDDDFSLDFAKFSVSLLERQIEYF